ncbi:CD248 molecule, endosialin a [Salminus brasiliensis]|uniref:CD248 molecule, endosialin a n=1 Tax=Salminus brasiliensis TaxID=930266 RepID=UPI003B839DF9
MWDSFELVSRSLLKVVKEVPEPQRRSKRETEREGQRERETAVRRMGSPVLSGATLLSVLLYLSSVLTQDLRDRDAQCNEDSCLVLYWQRKIFLDAWRSCKHEGGNLVTIKSPEEANAVDTLFSKMELREDQRVRVWIGLQRQPRKCSASRPMRGFSWITGEQDTQYTNWEQEDSPNTCSVPRCVSISYGAAPWERHNNLKWKDGPCSVPVDAYLCKYTFPGMCQAIRNEGRGNTLYTTPFHLVTAFLSHIPFGSVATVPCPTQDQTVLCTHREDETVGWNRDPPFCSDGPKTSWCHEDRGGCHHRCVEGGERYYCDCNEGFVLAQDGMTCVQIDPCQGSPCEFECLAVMDSYRCACPEGYMLAPDERGCLDVNECLQSPCEHLCINAPGTFECRCRDGYLPDEEGNCEDVDECVNAPCEHACENVMGSYICHCHLGFAPLPEDSSHCHDVDECQIEGTCEQMCINYNGGFDCYCKEGYEISENLYSCVPIGEGTRATASYPWITHLPDSMWKLQGPEYPWSQGSDSDYETETEAESLDWLTELPNVVPTDFWLLSNARQDATATETTTESLPGIINVELGDLDPQKVSSEASLTSTTLTPLSDYYEDESTTVTRAPPTPTMTFSPTPTEESYDSNANNDNYDYESTTSEPELPPFSQELPSTQGTGGTPKDGSNSPFITKRTYEYSDPTPTEGSYDSTATTDNSHSHKSPKDGSNSDQQTEGSSWLLVGLLVPLCIFIVVMIVLGVIYCTQCTAKPQNKNATDCYHWIAGAGDKAAADMAGGGITKV